MTTEERIDLDTYIQVLQKAARAYGLHEKYYTTGLPRLMPSELSALSVENQKVLIAKVQSDPDAGWAFFGPPGTGKSTLSAALFMRQLNHVYLNKQFVNFPVSGPMSGLFRITARQLCEDAQDYVMGRYEDGRDWFGPHGKRTIYAPIVSRARIMQAKQNGLMPRLFLEELDKVGMTDFRRDTIFDVINAVHECQGQLVVNSNLTLREYADIFGKAFWWRTRENCYTVDLFDGVGVVPPKAQQVMGSHKGLAGTEETE